MARRMVERGASSGCRTQVPLRGPALPLQWLALILWCCFGAAATAPASEYLPSARSVFETVPEGELPAGIVVAPATQPMDPLLAHPAGARARDALRAFLAAHWEAVRAVDVVALSRWHVEATRGWQAPATPVLGDVTLLASTPDALYLALRGPRLPASFPIVHRHLVFFARYDLRSGRVHDVAVSIHGEVRER